MENQAVVEVQCIKTCKVPPENLTGKHCLNCDFTKKLLAQMPPLGSQENNPDPVVPVKFFTPDSCWTWYPYEFDGEDEFFGLVQGFDEEFGSFLLSELQSATGPWGMPVERDLWFKPTPVSKLLGR